MGTGINRVFLFGNLGADPELHSVAGGMSVMKFNLATTTTWMERTALSLFIRQHPELRWEPSYAARPIVTKHFCNALQGQVLQGCACLPPSR